MTIALTLPEKASRITKSLDYVGADLYMCLISGTLSNYTCTFAASSDITATGNNYVVGMRVRFSTTGTLPAEINASTDYWVVFKSGATIRVSATRGGSAIVMSGAGSGTHTVLEQLPIMVLGGRNVCVHNWDAVVRQEISNYQEVPGRKLINLPSPTENYTTGLATATISATFTPSSPITFRYVALVREANATTGNTTGTLVGLYDYVTTQTITGSGTFNYDVAL